MTAANTRWCCAPFEFHYSEAGYRSIAVIVDRNADGLPEFILQSRAFSRNEEPGPLNIAVPISLVTQTGMNYCPWCGARLKRFYRKQIDALIRPGLRIDRGF